MFEEQDKKPFIELPSCEMNENKSKTFIKKFHKFTNDSFNIAIKWKTRLVKTLFPLKDKNPHLSCKIYEGKCIKCSVKYIGETKGNVETSWAEHNNPNYNSEPANHFIKNIDHGFDWKVFCDTDKNTNNRKNS